MITGAIYSESQAFSHAGEQNYNSPYSAVQYTEYSSL